MVSYYLYEILPMHAQNFIMDKKIDLNSNSDVNARKEKVALKHLRLRELSLLRCQHRNRQIAESYNLTLAIEKRNLMRLLQGFNKL